MLTLKINRPETVPGLFTKNRINDDLTYGAKTQSAEDKQTADHQNEEKVNESNQVTVGKSGLFLQIWVEIVMISGQSRAWEATGFDENTIEVKFDSVLTIDILSIHLS